LVAYSSSYSGRKSTVNLSVDSHLLQELRKEASSENLSLNAKINSVLSMHVNFYRINRNLGGVIWDYKVFLSFLDLIQEDKLAEILWNEGGNTVMSYFSHNNIPITKENFIKYICERIGIWTGQYSFFTHYTDTEGNTCLVFDHRFGLKWSRILARLHAKAIEHWLGLKSVSNVTPKTAILKILERDIT
jgi:hypothetical protein